MLLFFGKSCVPDCDLISASRIFRFLRGSRRELLQSSRGILENQHGVAAVNDSVTADIRRLQESAPSIRFAS